MKERRWFVRRGRVALAGVVLVLLFTAYVRAFRGHVIGSWRDIDDWRVPVAMAAVVTVFSFITLLALAAVLQARRERAQTAAFARGAPYRDHEFAAVAGTVRALDGTLTAPFSGRRCLAYEYEVWLGQGSIPGRLRNPEAGRGWAGVTGVALAPTVIDGPQGPVRIMGWTPLAPRFRPAWFDGRQNEVNRRLRELIAARKFEPMTGVKGFRLLGRLVGLQSDDDGRVAQDWCLDEAVLEAPRAVDISETVIEVGERIGACGLWSEEKRGLYGQVGRAGLELWPGDLDERRRRLLVEPSGRLAFMLMLTAALHGVVAIVWKPTEEVEAVRRAQAERRAAEAFNAVVWKDLEATRAALRAGVPVERRDHYGNTLLMEAAHQHDAAWVRMLLEEGASVHAENPRWGTALDQAIRTRLPGREEVIALLKEAGARDFRVGPENGRALPADGGAPGEAIHRWYRAIERGDLVALNAEFVGGGLEDIDWELWRRVRPLRIETISGFADDHAATLTVRGRDPDGRSRVWGYHLLRQAAPGPEWRIRWEWEME
jgi:hypothetical protein